MKKPSDPDTKSGWRRFPDVSSGMWQTSRAGGRPELFFQSGEGMMAVAVEASTVSMRTAILPCGSRTSTMIRERMADDAPRELRVVLNWVEELKRLVPTE